MNLIYPRSMRSKMKDIKKLLGRRIKELRRIKKYSQQELADKANIDQRSLSHIECGDNFPSKSLLDIANALEITLVELFDFAHLEVTSTEMANYIREEVSSLSEQNIQILYRVMKSLR